MYLQWSREGLKLSLPTEIRNYRYFNVILFIEEPPPPTELRSEVFQTLIEFKHQLLEELSKV